LAGFLAGCVTPAPPGELDVPEGEIHRIEGGPIEVRGSFALSGPRTISMGIGSLSVDEDQYTTAVITALAESLRQHGVRVESGADRVMEIQVVRISVHPKPQYTCVIDFNRRLGEAPARGLQSRAQSWDARKACSRSAAQVVVDVLNEAATRSYLKGG
jgi:hypothetical protein